MVREITSKILPGSSVEERPISIPDGDGFLTGSMAAPRAPRRAVLIANDRGCGRHVPSVCATARNLRAAGFATVMVDVVRPDERADAAWVRQQTALLAERIASARAWVARSELAGLPLTLLGLGAAAPAAALSAAVRPLLAPASPVARSAA